jgi:hypothetical protein
MWLVPLSTAGAQDTIKLCESWVQDADQPIYCINENAGLIGELHMTSNITAILAVRHLKGVICHAWGYDDVGNIVGRMTVTVDEGAAEKCFEADEGGCWDFSPIQLVSLWCDQIK